MITQDRLAEIESMPREAFIAKAEAKELANAYRERIPGLRVTKGSDGVWLHFTAPSGKMAAINLEVIFYPRGPLVETTVMEWANALEISGEGA